MIQNHAAAASIAPYSRAGFGPLVRPTASEPIAHRKSQHHNPDLAPLYVVGIPEIDGHQPKTEQFLHPHITTETNRVT